MNQRWMLTLLITIIHVIFCMFIFLCTENLLNSDHQSHVSLTQSTARLKYYWRLHTALEMHCFKQNLYCCGTKKLRNRFYQCKKLIAFGASQAEYHSVCTSSLLTSAVMSYWATWFAALVVYHLQILTNASKMSVHTMERAPTTWGASNVNAS